jgi:hypothetical protein
VVEEAQEGRDLNGNGRVEDTVLHVFDGRSGAFLNTRLAVGVVNGILALPTQRFFAVEALETDGDLNGDGDASDEVLHTIDAASGRTVNLRRAVSPVFSFGPFPAALIERRFLSGADLPGPGDAFAFGVDEASQGARDLNGDGDADDVVIHALRLDGGNSAR